MLERLGPIGIGLAIGVCSACGSEPSSSVAADGDEPGVSGSGLGGAAAGGASGGSLPGSAGAAASSCAPASPVLSPWPGRDEVKTLEPEPLFETDLSGLTYEPGEAGQAGVLWAVDNVQSKLFRLVEDTSGFAADAMNGWANGRSLHYPSGMSGPDAEGVTLAASPNDGLYVCSEHDNQDPAVSRQSILRYDVAAAGAGLTASHEWVVTALLPELAANAGIEAITWVPDSYLIAKAFLDESRAHTYRPADYAEHGQGLFFVGVEQTGRVYVLAPNHVDSSASLIATIATPGLGVMGLEFDRDAGNLWFYCDETCDNHAGILDVDTGPGSATLGKFVVRRVFLRPSTLPNSNNEGIALAPDAECSGGFKRFFWTDDAGRDGFSLRSDFIPCATCL